MQYETKSTLLSTKLKWYSYFTLCMYIMHNYCEHEVPKISWSLFWHHNVLHVQEHCEHCGTQESKKDEIYWEPAGSVNELYKQLCLNKYREIEREEVK